LTSKRRAGGGTFAEKEAGKFDEAQCCLAAACQSMYAVDCREYDGWENPRRGRHDLAQRFSGAAVMVDPVRAIIKSGRDFFDSTSGKERVPISWKPAQATNRGGWALGPRSKVTSLPFACSTEHRHPLRLRRLVRAGQIMSKIKPCSSFGEREDP